jgi:hypothetical protein
MCPSEVIRVEEHPLIDLVYATCAVVSSYIDDFAGSAHIASE